MGLKIYKKSTKVWQFIDSELGEFIPSRFSINTFNNIVTVIYKDGANSKNYNLSVIELYDLNATSPFPIFIDVNAFMLKLEEMHCPCFYVDGEYIFNPSMWVSSDANNNLSLGTDGKFFVPESSVSSVDWGSITGTLSTQTDLQNALDLKQDNLNYPTNDNKDYVVNNGVIKELVASGGKTTFDINFKGAFTLAANTSWFGFRSDSAGGMAMGIDGASTTQMLYSYLTYLENPSINGFAPARLIKKNSKIKSLHVRVNKNDGNSSSAFEIRGYTHTPDGTNNAANQVEVFRINTAGLVITGNQTIPSSHITIPDLNILEGDCLTIVQRNKTTTAFNINLDIVVEFEEI